MQIAGAGVGQSGALRFRPSPPLSQCCAVVDHHATLCRLISCFLLSARLMYDWYLVVPSASCCFLNIPDVAIRALVTSRLNACHLTHRR